MRILLDKNTPAPLRHSLLGHRVETAYKRGWSELLNGKLIAEAESAGFDVLITSDQNIRYQKNWTKARAQSPPWTTGAISLNWLQVKIQSKYVTKSS